ncbi:leukotriene B4 receptor 1-like [Pygocentrus nattereri]|uniref:G-protein coupled receptors family 1 profile domain-containing protein n=1 Tax=Pygocentrus nattereri TaxID=42514 RepID=A0A3B4CSZ7_PYGNA|nr:leukotriene B4 receptor 1-like [Pygocentrus nattereri]
MQQENCSSGSQLNDALPVYKASSAVLAICFVLGVPGNLSVLVILVRRLKENSFTLRMMLSLALSDLLTLSPMPMWIWSLLHNWIFGFVACKIISFVEYWCTYSSILCVTFLSLQRYLQVLHPQKWAQLGFRGKNGLLCGIWILSGVFASYALVQRDVGCDQYGFQYCYQNFRNKTEQVATSIFEILLFLTCFFLLVYFYYRLYRGVNESPFSSSNRMTKLVTRIVVAFFIFGVPVTIANILIVVAALLENETLSVTADLGSKISTALLFLNSCVNPFLYTFSLRQLQHQSTVTETLGPTLQNGA